MANKKPKYSYTRLSCWKDCGLRYFRRYIENKYIGGDTLNTQLGVLVHKCEEIISQILKVGERPNYDKIREYAHTVNIPKKNKYDTEGGIFGVDILSKKYLEEWWAPSEKTGLTYASKVNDYFQTGLKRQELFMQEHPELEIWDVEHPFEFEYEGETIKGFIDRVLKYKGEDRYIIYDIKTRDRLFDNQDVTTPLQFVCYALSLQKELGLEEAPTECFYDLVFINQMQSAGTKGFIKRGKTALDKIFTGIHNGIFEPHPSPLCYWCEYCNTNPNITPEGKDQCPYYSLWTPEKSSFAKNMEWRGMEFLQEDIEALKLNSVDAHKWDGFVL